MLTKTLKQVFNHTVQTYEMAGEEEVGVTCRQPTPITQFQGNRKMSIHLGLSTNLIFTDG